jgi:hypothetical protein
MTGKQYLTAYLATLGALVAVFAIAVVAGAVNGAVIGKIEAFGLGTITGGLIGLLRLPSTRGSGATIEAVDDLAGGEK